MTQVVTKCYSLVVGVLDRWFGGKMAVPGTWAADSYLQILAREDLEAISGTHFYDASTSGAFHETRSLFTALFLG